MREFFASFTKTIDKLWQMQQSDPPAILQEAFAKVLRFGLVAICIAAAIFAVQLVIVLCTQKQRKQGIAFGAVCLVCVLVAVWAFVPIGAAPKSVTDSAAVQTLHYISTKELAAQEAAAQAKSEAAVAAAAPAPAEGEPAVEEETAPPAEGVAVPAAANADTTGAADGLASGNPEADAAEDEEENPLLDDALHRIVTQQAELTKEQAAAIDALLKSTKCTRTTRRSLPQENAKNVLLRLEDGARWQVLLLPDEGYVYATEATGFLCKINDYDTFYKQIQSML